MTIRFRYPPTVLPERSVLTHQSNTVAYPSPLTQSIQTDSRTGEHIRLSLVFSNLDSAKRERLGSLLSKLNGQQNRLILRDHAYESPRGSIAGVSEQRDVIFNAANYTSSTPNRGSVIDVEDGIRWETSFEPLAGNISASADGVIGLVLGRIYAATMIVQNFVASPFDGTVSDVSLAIRESDFGTVINSQDQQSTPDRMKVAALAYNLSEFFVQPLGNTSAAGGTGSLFDMYDLSVARCLLVDNGINNLLRSQEFDDVGWTKTRSSINANQGIAPDGSTTGDLLVEDATAASSHFTIRGITKDPASQYWTFTVYAKRNSRDNLWLQLDDGASTNTALAFYDLTGSGAIGNTSVTGNFSNVYASIDDLSNTWVRCRLTCLTNSTAALRAYIGISNPLNTFVYDGDGVSNVIIWGAQLQQGFAPGRYVATTTTPATGTEQQGSDIWVKGLDTSSSDQLLPNDQVEIGGQLTVVQEPVNSDPSGTGRMTVGPRIRSGLADETPIILYRPHGVFILDGDSASISTQLPVLSNLTLDVLEDVLA